MVKRSKGKSIRGAKWFGQEQVFSETRGKPAEWDTTKGTKLIIPFLNGLNHPIKKIANFQPYSNLIELMHQATKAERQVQDDFKYAKYLSKSYGFSNNQASTPPQTST